LSKYSLIPEIRRDSRSGAFSAQSSRFSRMSMLSSNNGGSSTASKLGQNIFSAMVENLLKVQTLSENCNFCFYHYGFNVFF
jgi:hypothetical protein